MSRWSVVDEMIGKKFGRLTVVALLPNRHRREKVYACQCECGKTYDAIGYKLRGGIVRSCGCYMIDKARADNTRHGMSGEKIHAVWNSMLQRCSNPNNPAYQYYGGRGITVCDRWLIFDNFLADMGIPSKGLSLDRIDNSQGYNPDNCKWSTREEQANNKRNNRILEFEGRSQTVSQWAREMGSPPTVFHCRLKLGWSIERTLTTPYFRRSSILRNGV